MEPYERKTRKVIRSFLSRKLTFPACIAALDAALSPVIPNLAGKVILPLRALMLTNNETVKKEMERRASLHKK
jgi:hypothetical protein